MLHQESPPSSNHASLSPAQSICLTIAAAAIGFAIFQHGGEYTVPAIILVAASLFAMVVAFFPRVWHSHHPAPAPASNRKSSLIVFCLGAALWIQFVALLQLWPVGADHAEAYQSRGDRAMFCGLMFVAAVCTLVGAVGARGVARYWFPGLLIVHSLLTIWAVRASPDPQIDVWRFQQEGAKALLRGVDPYDWKAVKFPDIYHSTLPGHQRVYGEGLVERDVLKFGFPYLPLSLYFSTAGVRLGGDTRYAQALALTLAGLFIGYARPGRQSKLAAALLLFTPTEWFVLQRSWTEPFVVMFLGLTVFCAARRLRWLTPIAFGLFLASKQYLALAVPLSFMLVDQFDVRSGKSWRRWIVLLIGAGLTAAAVTLPLALRDWNAFYFSIVTVQKWAPFRWDALSFMVMLAFINSAYTAWVWVAFVAVVPAVFLAIWRSGRSVAGFAMGLSFVYLVFIAFNKQAFCNYYFFVVGALCCAIAAGASEPADSKSNQPA